jgi:hypothetical protein
MLKCTLLLSCSLLAIPASADTFRSSPGIASGTSGYLSAYVDMTSQCAAGTFDDPGSCSGTSTSRAVLIDDNGHVSAGPFSAGDDQTEYQEIGNVVSAGGSDHRRQLRLQPVGFRR